MSSDKNDKASEIFADQILGFTIAARDTRGRVVRLDNVLNDILSTHEYPAPIAHLLSEALVLAALMGSLLKDEGGQMTLQAQTKGQEEDAQTPIRLLVCDYRAGELRGYVDFDAEAVAAIGDEPSISALFPSAYLAITFDKGGEGGRYQGIVPLEGKNLAACCEAYFANSEQIPTILRIASSIAPNYACAGGLLLQYLPDGEEGRERLHTLEDGPDWQHITIMGGGVKPGELLDPELSAEALVWRLFHEEEEIRTTRGANLSKGCRCNAEHYRQVLSQFPKDQLDAMRDEAGLINVDCAFCAKLFPIPL